MAETDLFEFESRILANARTVFDDADSSATGYRDALGKLIGHYERLMRETRRLIRRSDREELEMNRLNQRLQELAQELGFRVRHDTLTRALNRGAVIEQANAILARDSLAVVILDIDNFKRINDTYGHPVGDKILATVASVIRANIRRDVFAARTGGEEFALIIEGNTAEEVLSICERIRRTLESTPFKNSRTRVDYGPITISLGICMAVQAEDPGELYGKTDIALYCAKNSGRNCSFVYQDGMHKDMTKNWLIYKA